MFWAEVRRGSSHDQGICSFIHHRIQHILRTFYFYHLGANWRIYPWVW